MEFNPNLLMSVVEVTNQHEEDAVGLEVLRNEVFAESMFHESLRNAFNSDLRGLQGAGLVTLTRNGVALTQEGFDEAWKLTEKTHKTEEINE
jgi:hypothetical protein